MRRLKIIATWCKRKALCYYCKEHIEAGEPMLVQRFWSKGKSYRAFYHLSKITESHEIECCFVKQSMVYLNQHPYQTPNHPGSGRPRLELSDEDREKRNRLLRRYGAIKWRIMLLPIHGMPVELHDRFVERLKELHRQQSEIYKEIEVVGGIPRSWR